MRRPILRDDLALDLDAGAEVHREVRLEGRRSFRWDRSGCRARRRPPCRSPQSSNPWRPRSPPASRQAGRNDGGETFGVAHNLVLRESFAAALLVQRRHTISGAAWRSEDIFTRNRASLQGDRSRTVANGQATFRCSRERDLALPLILCVARPFPDRWSFGGTVRVRSPGASTLVCSATFALWGCYDFCCSFRC